MITYKIKAAIDRFNNKSKIGLNSIKLLGSIPTELEDNINEMKQILSSYTQ